MGLFDTTNQSLQGLIGARAQKKQLELDEEQLKAQKRQNVFNNITGAVSGLAGLAKTGFDVYDKLKLQPEREQLAFDRENQQSATAFENAKELEGIRAANNLDANKQNIDYQKWATTFNAEQQAILAEKGITQEQWKTMFTEAATSSRADKQNVLTEILQGRDIDAQMARQLAAQAFQTSERKETQAYQTGERVASQEFQMAYAKAQSALKKDEMGYSADLDAKAAEQANKYTVALAGINTENAIKVAKEQSVLDTARDLALQDAKTEDQKEIILLDYEQQSKQLAEKYGYDLGLIEANKKSQMEVNEAQNKLGIQRDLVGYDAQAKRDEILNGYAMQGKQFDRETQEKLVNIQLAADKELAKAKSDLSMAEALYADGLADENDVETFKRQLELTRENNAHAALMLDKEYGYKMDLQDDEQEARINEIRETGAQNTALENLRGSNDLNIARVNANADVQQLQTQFNLGSEKDAMQAYSSPSDAILFKRSQISESDASLGIKRSQSQIDADVAKMILADAEYYKAKGWTAAEDVARRAYSQLAGSSSGSQGNTIPKNDHDGPRDQLGFVFGATGAPYQNSGNNASVMFNVGPGAKGLIGGEKSPETWIPNADGKTESRLEIGLNGKSVLVTRDKITKKEIKR